MTELNKYEHDNVTLYVASQITKLLGYKSLQYAMLKVKEIDKIPFSKYQGTSTPKQSHLVMLITIQGIIDLIKNTRHKLPSNIRELLGINLTIQKDGNIKIDESQPVNIPMNTTALPPERELTMYSYIADHLCFEYFVGYEVATLMNYKNVSVTLRKLSSSEKLLFKDYPGVKFPKLDDKAILITRDGATELLEKSNKLLTDDVYHILNQVGIQLKLTKTLTKEQRNLGFVTDAFKIENMIPQYPIDNGRYRIDLYFPEYKIIVDCDENGHLDRDLKAEKTREEFINATLGISMDNWIRFNPDGDDKEIAKVIGKIYMIISRMKNSSHTMKRCCTCRKEKPTDKFYFNKKNGDGLEKRCKECKTTIYHTLLKSKEQKGGIVPDEKHCRQCETTKPNTDFWKDKGSKDGLQAVCSDCAKADVQKKREAEKEEPKQFKMCRICKKTKETVTSFGKLNRNIDGYETKCKDCQHKISKKNIAVKAVLPKACQKCKKVKPLTEYKKVTSGHGKVCNACNGVNGTDEKLCNTCDTVKKKSEFYKLHTSADGLNSKCKDCAKTYIKNLTKDENEDDENEDDEEYEEGENDEEDDNEGENNYSEYSEE